MLESFPVVVDVVVRWADMDALGHVNHLMYLQYFEIARIEYLMRLGMTPPGQAWGESGFILAGVSCRFLAPVTFPDTLAVGARIAKLGTDRAVMEHAAFSHRLGRTVAEGDAVVVGYDYQRQCRIELSDSLRETIRLFEGRDISPLEGRFPPSYGTASRSS